MSCEIHFLFAILTFTLSTDMLVEVRIPGVVVIFVDVTAIGTLLVGVTDGTDVFGSPLKMVIVTVVTKKPAVT